MSVKKLLFSILLLIFLVSTAGCFGGKKKSEYFTLTIKINPPESGSVVRTPAGPAYKKGTKVTLLAEAAEGWKFSRWEGDLTDNKNPAAVTMNGNKSVTAVFVGAAGYGAVTGRVTLGRAGSAVTGATITLLQDGTKLYSTVTNEMGQYSLPIPDGGNVDLVAAKSGLAGSRFQGIDVPADGIFIADIIMKDRGDLNYDTNPPVLIVTGVSPGDEISGRHNIGVELAEECDLKRVLIGIGTEFPYNYVIEYPPYSVTLDTYVFPDGESFIHLVAYDLNNNCVITHIPVVIENDDTTGPPLTMTEKICALAITVGDDLQLDSLKKLGRSIDRNFIHKDLFSRLQKGFSIMAAEKNSACYVLLEWKNEFLGNPDFKGFNVYRSSSPNGPWRRLGPAYDDYDWYYIYDTTSEVTPGERSYYKVVPYSASGREGSGQTQSVIPLGRFEVNLTTPVHNAEGVSLNPTLSWNHNGLEAQMYYYELYLLSLGDEPFQDARTWVIGDAGLKSVAYNQKDWGGREDCYLFPLRNNWRYQWDVIQAEAVTVYKDGYDKFGEYVVYSGAVSMGIKGDSSGSYNGAFVFTTGE